MLAADIIDYEGRVGQTKGQAQKAAPAFASALTQPGGRQATNKCAWVVPMVAQRGARWPPA
ncbi:MAG TPA: hypothetical protein VFW76_12255 [Ktedonobacterales bacterium]|nr:hypothetical protein [Ktedonobacterales bacterium]